MANRTEQDLLGLEILHCPAFLVTVSVLGLILASPECDGESDLSEVDEYKVLASDPEGPLYSRKCKPREICNKLREGPGRRSRTETPQRTTGTSDVPMSTKANSGFLPSTQLRAKVSEVGIDIASHIQAAPYTRPVEDVCHTVNGHHFALLLFWTETHWQASGGGKDFHHAGHIPGQ